MKNRIVSMILVFCMLLSMVPAVAAAEAPSLTPTKDYTHVYLSSNEDLFMELNRDDAGQIHGLVDLVYAADLTGNETQAELKALAGELLKNKDIFFVRGGCTGRPMPVTGSVKVDSGANFLDAGTYLWIVYLADETGLDDDSSPEVFFENRCLYDTICVAGLHISGETTHEHTFGTPEHFNNSYYEDMIGLKITCLDCGYWDVIFQDYCPSTAMKDVPSTSNWAHAGIDYCIDNGLMNGVAADRFDPSGLTTRAQFVTILWRQAGSPEPTKAAPFVDVKGSAWYAKAAAWAFEKGIVNGTDATHFSPNVSLTRQMCAAILYRYTANVLKMDMSEYIAAADGLKKFADRNKVDNYAKDALSWATSADIITGYEKNGVFTLKPNNTATRAEIATIFMRYVESDIPEAPEEFDISIFNPITENDRYVYNPYLLSQEALRSFDVGFLEFYKNFLDAYMNYETECPCPELTYAQDIRFVLEYECPFYAEADMDLNWTNYDYEGKRLTWTYDVDQAALQERIRKVADIMQGFLDKVTPSTSEADKMQTLYHAFCPLMTYDDDRLESREKIDACYALLEHRGICVTFSFAMAQILAQVNIDATVAGGDTGDIVGHEWNYVRINGKYYFFDPTFELSFKNGTAYVYYGMTLQERLSSGIVPGTINLGRYQYYDMIVSDSHLNVH